MGRPKVGVEGMTEETVHTRSVTVVSLCGFSGQPGVEGYLILGRPRTLQTYRTEGEGDPDRSRSPLVSGSQESVASMVRNYYLLPFCTRRVPEPA